MIRPIINSFAQPRTVFSFKNSNNINDSDIKESLDTHFKTIEAQNDLRNNMLKRFALATGIFATAFLVPAGVNALVHFSMAKAKLKPKIDKNVLFKPFESLKDDSSIPVLDECKSLNSDLKDYLQHQINFIKSDSETRYKAGMPPFSNRLLLSGEPGCGKSFFAKVFAKSIDADYIEVKHSDFNSEWGGKGTDNFKKIFESILQQVQGKSDKKFVVTFNEIDTIIQPIEKITEGKGGSYFMTKLEHRSVFLNYLDELKSKAPNVIVIGTTNLSPRNNNLDRATLSRFKNILELPMPNEKCLFEALKSNLKTIDEGKFIETNSLELKKLAQKLTSRKSSFRDLENIVEKSKNYYLDDLLKDKEKPYNMEYLKKAESNLSLTDGEMGVKK